MTSIKVGTGKVKENLSQENGCLKFLQDFQNLRFVVAVKILAPPGAAHIALCAPLRGGVFPDVVGQTLVDEMNAAAVVVFPVFKGHILAFQTGLNGFQTHKKSPYVCLPLLYRENREKQSPKSLPHCRRPEQAAEPEKICPAECPCQEQQGK